MSKVSSIAPFFSCFLTKQIRQTLYLFLDRITMKTIPLKRTTEVHLSEAILAFARFALNSLAT